MSQANGNIYIRLCFTFSVFFSRLARHCLRNTETGAQSNSLLCKEHFILRHLAKAFNLSELATGFYSVLCFITCNFFFLVFICNIESLHEVPLALLSWVVLSVRLSYGLPSILYCPYNSLNQKGGYHEWTLSHYTEIYSSHFKVNETEWMPRFLPRPWVYHKENSLNDILQFFFNIWTTRPKVFFSNCLLTFHKVAIYIYFYSLEFPAGPIFSDTISTLPHWIFTAVVNSAKGFTQCNLISIFPLIVSLHWDLE